MPSFSYSSSKRSCISRMFILQCRLQNNLTKFYREYPSEILAGIVLNLSTNLERTDVSQWKPTITLVLRDWRWGVRIRSTAGMVPRPAATSGPRRGRRGGCGWLSGGELDSPKSVSTPVPGGGSRLASRRPARGLCVWLPAFSRLPGRRCVTR